MIRNVIAAAVLGCLLLVAWSVWQQLDRPVRAVRVEGRLSPSEQQAIRRAVTGSLDDGVLSLDVSEVSRRIRALSWPRSVEVRRVWPDTLTIRVEKESVVAAWGDGGYLTSAGKVVQLADGAGHVPELASSLSPPRRAMEVYQMLESRVNAAGFSIVRLEENSLGEWLMTFDGGMTVALGNEALTERLERFLLAYRRALATRSGEIRHVDVRYANGLAVAWKQSPTNVGATSRSRSPETLPGSEASRPGGRSHSKEQQQPGPEYALR